MIGKVKKILNQISISKKMMIIFLGCFIIPNLIQYFFYFYETENNIQNKFFERMNNALHDKAKEINISLLDLTKILLKYNNDEVIYKCLDTNYLNDISYLKAYQDNIKQRVEAELPLHLQIDKIVFYTDNTTIFSSALVRQLIPDGEDGLKDYQIGFNVNKTKNATSTLSLLISLKHNHSISDKKRQISIMRTMDYFPQYSQYKKKLGIELNHAYYASLLSDNSLFDNLLLTDMDGRILFSSNSYRKTGDFDIFDHKELEKGVIVLEKQLDYFPLVLYGYYNSNLISDQFKKSLNGAIIIGCISITIALLCIWIIGKNIAKRTQHIVDRSMQIAQGNFNQMDNALLGGDEIGIIEESISRMGIQLQEFIDEKYRSRLIQARLEQEVTQAKLLALQSQVNPHFLFNALESIRLNAFDSEKHETAAMIKHMSKMFRYLVDWDKEIIYLKDEIEFLHQFLSIQKYRFGDEFQYIIDVEETTQYCLLPKLIIQPLVENACIHGVEAISHEKQVFVSVSIEDDWLIIKVEDNGGGMPPDRLKEVHNMLDRGCKISGSVGLYNVHQRLLLNYDKNFKFIFDSIKGKGIICVVKIPIEYDGC